MHCAVETGGFEHELEVLVGHGRTSADPPVRTALAPAEAEVLAADAADFAGALRDPNAQARYLRLASAAAAGAVPADLVPALETMLELLFEKGRPSNRAVLQTVFAKTPRGRQQSAASREVNKALRALRGQQLEELRPTSGGPGRHAW